MQPTIGTLVALEELYVGNNQLQDLPESVGHLRNLRVLSAPALPADRSSLRGLELLNVENNLITELPAGIGNLADLRYLLATGNAFATVPDSVRNLRNLERLSIGSDALNDAEVVRVQRLLPWADVSRDGS